MRSYRTYADDTGTIDIGATCRRIAAVPDLPEADRLATESSDEGASVPGVYPLEVVMGSGGESLRLMGPSVITFASERLVREITGAQAHSCWRVRLLDEGEDYQHIPGVRALFPMMPVNQFTLFSGTPQEIIDGTAPDWEGNPFGESGFVVHPYTESLRLNFQTTEATFGPVTVQVWAKGPEALDTSAYPGATLNNYGWTLWESFSIGRDTTFIRNDVPHGCRVVMTTDVPTAFPHGIRPTVRATLRFP
ncbi:hypothetical protein [Archangium violaceum]|uniref:Uncharacterized protein n=1 Tax=Archangium violaceum Cb vi76 TaxID=1406225 RepID=A0A084SE16_9BACT|nr:hypothetical protein [Archangium violaceum]KFA86701.1 hypothetical protein Q664_52775 [Archangium violaceum Cb vi76]